MLTALALTLAQVPLEPPASEALRPSVVLQLYVRQLTPSAGLDLPPLDQRPAVYAELSLDGQQRTTEAIAPERIGDSIYPNWGLSARRPAPQLAPGDAAAVVIRAFDRDSELEDIVDDKVLLAALEFDPYTCEAVTNAVALTGRWQDEATCVLPIDTLEGETGEMSIVLAARWTGIAPGRPSREGGEETEEPQP
ncbi:MAG: hypothetical protein AAF289_22775 [Cyanobacteria bacterium P01_A01_bin.135]